MKCSTCNNGKVVCDGQVIECPSCKGDGIAPTPRVNCSGCGTPHPDHETALGMCVLCLGNEVQRSRELDWDRSTGIRRLNSEIETERVCNWREHQPGWAFCGCQVISRPIEMVVLFKFCPFCGGRIEIKRGSKG